MTDFVEVRVAGPIFDGLAEAEAQEAMVAARHAIAVWTEALVQAEFNKSIQQNNSKFLLSILIVDRTRTFAVSGDNGKTYTLTADVPALAEIVTTSMATYGPWLEGVGSRNASSQFKGYWGFRNAVAQAQITADSIAELAIQPWVAKMNL